MAFQQKHSSKTGNEGNYWKVIQTNFNQLAGTGKVTLFLYKNKGARQSGKSSMDQRDYVISSDEFDEFFAPDALDPVGKNIVERSYAMVKARREVTKDRFQKINEKYYADADVTDGKPNDGALEVDEDKAAESFFDSAIDV